MDRFEVVWEARLSAPIVDDLHDRGAEIADALDGSVVEDAFVQTDSGAGKVRIEFTVAASDETEALAIGVGQVRAAMVVAGFVNERAMTAPSAHAGALAA